MAKQHRRRKRSDARHFEGQTVDQLEHALELDSLTMESCFFGLFGELFEDIRPGQRRARTAEEIRVTQAGPGVRNPASDEDGGE